jgi:hypothetical protein
MPPDRGIFIGFSNLGRDGDWQSKIRRLLTAAINVSRAWTDTGGRGVPSTALNLLAFQ